MKFLCRIGWHNWIVTDWQLFGPIKQYRQDTKRHCIRCGLKKEYNWAENKWINPANWANVWMQELRKEFQK